MARWMVMVGVVTFLAGLLFGYDQGVISGALPLIKDDLDLSTFASEVITSWVTLGALGGGLVAGALADKVGRRRAAILAGLLFAGGALLETVAPGAALLTVGRVVTGVAVGRVVTGVAVGFASTVAPLYAAEMAPASLRGRFVSAYQLAITVGIFFAYLADDALTSSGRPTTRSRLEFEFRITLRGDLGFTAWSRAVRYHRTPHERAV